MHKVPGYIKVTVTAVFLIISLISYGQRDVPLAYDPLTVKVNYVRTWDVIVPTTDAGSLTTFTTLDKARMTTQYLDGLGRPLQTVVKQGSLVTGGTPTDVVAPTEYDAFGREQFKYLPFASGSNNGLFKLDPFEEQRLFYSSAASPIAGQGEKYFYSQTNFEASPLNRVEKALAPGDSWVGAGRGLEAKQWINTAADAVRIWNVSDATTPFGTFTSPAVYAAGELYKNVTVDEAGNQVIEFKDKEGKVVLKKVQLSTAAATADDGSGRSHVGWLCTYYIYDDLNQLRCVVQPRGVEALLLPQLNWNLHYSADALINEQCFRYVYDGRGRMVSKKVPGAEPVYLVYDARDRLVMTQDGKQRPANQWMVTTYDALNRPNATYLINTPGQDIGFHLGAVAAATGTDYPKLSLYPLNLELMALLLSSTRLPLAS